MNTKQKHSLTLEPLEPRCLLSGYWEGIDVDGDAVCVELKGPGQLDVITYENGLGEQIDTIAVYDTTKASTLTVDVFESHGDGYVDVGCIDATGEDLKQIVVYGNIGNLEAGSVKRIYFDNAVTLNGQTGEWFIGSNVKLLYAWGNLDTTDIQIAGKANKVVIEGSLIDAGLLVDGKLLKMAVIGDVAEDSMISVLGQINRLVVYGFLDYSTVETAGQLKLLHVGGDVVDADIYADRAIHRIYVDGGIENTMIETPGRIQVLDSWDWIVDTDIIAGRQGIQKLFAYNLSNVNIDTSGDVRFLYLDAYDRNAHWDDLYIYTEEYYYWPIFDEQYIDIVYYEDSYDFYYDPYYWDTYYYDDSYYDVYVEYFDSYSYDYGVYVDLYW